MEGLSQARGDLRGIRDEEGVLGDGHRCTHDVGFLEGVAANQGSSDLSRDHDDRDRVHARVAQGRQHVGGSRAGRHDRAANLPGGQGVTFGGMSRTLLVTDKNVAQRRRRHQRVVGGKNCATGHTEHIGNAQGLEAGHNCLGSGHAGGVGGVAHHSSSQSLGPSQRKNPVRSAGSGCGDLGVRSILTLRGRHRTPGYDDQGEDSNSANVEHGFTVSLLRSPLLTHLIVRTLRP